MATMTNTFTGRKAIGISFATQYVELGIQFVSVMVLARILSPSEIGTFSVAAMLMTMLHTFRDFGVIQYIIQERELDRDKLSSVMGVAILLALAIAGVMALLSVPVAQFYANQALRDVMLVMAASFAISPFGSVVLGVLRREGRLDAIFYVKTFAALCQVSVGIFQGESRLVKDNIALGGFALNLSPRRKNEQSIEVRFTYDINGILEVSAQAAADGASERIVIRHGPDAPQGLLAEERLRALAALKIHPREAAANRLLLARAERLFEELLGPSRDALGQAIDTFDSALQSQALEDIDQAAQQLAALLKRMEAGHSS